MLQRIILVIVVSGIALSGRGFAQAPSRHIIVLPMANVSKPKEIDFEGATCDIDKTGRTMTCEFHQVLMGVRDSNTCEITTNSYLQTFQKQDTHRWVSNSGPNGVCGVVVVTTLEQQDSNVPSIWRVTMDSRKIVTNKGASTLCNVLDESQERLSWQYDSRPLPCKTVKAGSISQ